MAEQNQEAAPAPEKAPELPAFSLEVAPSPHLAEPGFTTRRMMMDVLIALVPALAMSVYMFRQYALLQVGVSVASCLVAEAGFAKLRGLKPPVGDLSALVTGIILGLSLPWSAPWYIAVIASLIAMGFGKAAFGGLGFNIFNPAMVGRAFVMLSFAKEMGAGAYVCDTACLDAVTSATPLTVAKVGAAIPDLWPMFLGTVNGSLGETSALAALLGGAYLCLRRSASWQIPLGVVAGASAFAGLLQVVGLSQLTVLQHLLSGALLFGAFFIATDPVTSPLTSRAKLIFGAGVGLLVVSLRFFSGYPEGLMFAILLMNALVPLLNRWTIPTPVGGPVPEKKA